MSQEQLCGYLKIVDHYHKKNKSFNSKLQDGHLYWASLKNFTLSLWVKANQEMSSTLSKRSGKSSLKLSLNKAKEKALKPDVVISVKKGIQIKRCSNSFSITIQDGQVYVMSVLNKDDLQLWVSHIEQHVQDHIAWESIADVPMEILSPSPTSSPLGGGGIGSSSTLLRTRAAGSLYDETSLNRDENDEESDSVHHHSPIPTLQSPYLKSASRNGQPSTIKSSSTFFTRAFNGSTGSDSSSSPVLF